MAVTIGMICLNLKIEIGCLIYQCHAAATFYSTQNTSRHLIKPCFESCSLRSKIICNPFHLDLCSILVAVWLDILHYKNLMLTIRQWSCKWILWPPSSLDNEIKSACWKTIKVLIKCVIRDCTVNHSVFDYVCQWNAINDLPYTWSSKLCLLRHRTLYNTAYKDCTRYYRGLLCTIYTARICHVQLFTFVWIELVTKFLMGCVDYISYWLYLTCMHPSLHQNETYNVFVIFAVFRNEVTAKWSSNRSSMQLAT